MGEQEYEVEVEREVLDAVLDYSPTVKMDEERRAELEGYLRDMVPALRRQREDILLDLVKHRATLGGKRKLAPVKQGMSNLSVPLMMWASTATRARLDQGILGSTPMVAAKPVGKTRGDDGTDYNQVAADLARWIEAEIRSPRALNGAEVILKTNAEDVNFGMTAAKVCVEADKVRLLPPQPGMRESSQVVEHGRVRWAHIRIDDLLWCEGYGTDTQAMPLVGHEFDRTWSDILFYEERGWYAEDVVERIKGTFLADSAPSPAAKRTHRIAEIYLDYVIDDSGIPASICVDYHIDAQVLLWVRWNNHPRGYRPIFMCNFDYSPDLTSAAGQGVCTKLNGAQDETDVIHNLTIEASKRAVAHLVVLKAGTGAEEELGGDQPVLPGTVLVTENPGEDLVTHPLGDPKGVEVGLAVERNTLGYVFRMLGFDEAGLGNVESGKRVPASLGLTTIREGRIVITQALNSHARMLEEMIYYTLELYKQRLPLDTLRTVLSPQAAQAVYNVVFSTNDVTMRSQFSLTVNAQDAATMTETRKQELIVLNQTLMGYYDKLLQYASLAMQMPPPLQQAVLGIMTKLEAGIRALLTTIEAIPNPDEVLLRVEDYMGQLQQASAQMQAMQAQARMMPGQSQPQPQQRLQ